MSALLRIVLIVVSVLAMLFVLLKVRKSKLKIDYSLFWIIFSILVLIVSIFPGIAYGLSDLLGFMAPVNFVFLFIIFLLLIHSFYITQKLSKTENMVQSLTEELAVAELLHREEAQKKTDGQGRKKVLDNYYQKV